MPPNLTFLKFLFMVYTQVLTEKAAHFKVTSSKKDCLLDKTKFKKNSFQGLVNSIPRRFINIYIVFSYSNREFKNFKCQDSTGCN